MSINRSQFPVLSYAHAVMANHTNAASVSQNTSSSSPNTHSYGQSIENNSHPLYLHNNDQPGMVLISKKLTGSENYASWKRSM